MMSSKRSTSLLATSARRYSYSVQSGFVAALDRWRFFPTLSKIVKDGIEDRGEATIGNCVEIRPRAADMYMLLAVATADRGNMVIYLANVSTKEVVKSKPRKSMHATD